MEATNECLKQISIAIEIIKQYTFEKNINDSHQLKEAIKFLDKSIEILSKTL